MSLKCPKCGEESYDYESFNGHLAACGMIDFEAEIFEERKRIWTKYGRQKKPFREWAKIISKQVGDIYLTAFILDGKVEMAEKRKQLVQIAAACAEALENSDAW